jgi:hypothetical protein
VSKEMPGRSSNLKNIVGGYFLDYCIGGYSKKNEVLPGVL